MDKKLQEDILVIARKLSGKIMRDNDDPQHVANTFYLYLKDWDVFLRYVERIKDPTLLKRRLAIKNRVFINAAVQDISPENWINLMAEFLRQEENDTMTNLCDECFHEIPECPCENEDMVYGDGEGADNVVKCGFFLR